MTAPPPIPGGRPWDRLFHPRTPDGLTLRAALWRAAGTRRGHVLLLSGRTEFLEKMALPAAGFAARGFDVVSLDWRGQGLSDRTVPALRGHVEDFADYQTDLAALLAHPEVAALAGPRLLFGHSMGGAIALAALRDRRVAPVAAVLSAPMIDIRMGRAARGVAALAGAIARAVRRTDLWPPVPNAHAPYVFSGFEGNLLTTDPVLFDWMVETLRAEPRLQLAMPTLGWLSAAGRECRRIAAQGPLGLPGLCLLGTAEQVVEPAAIRAAAPRLGLDLVEIEGARHELLLERPELRDRAWAAIDGFLDRSLGEAGI